MAYIWPSPPKAPDMTKISGWSWLERFTARW